METHLFNSIGLNHRKKLILSHPFFILLKPEEAEELAMLFDEKKVAQGEVIVNEGSAIDNLYFVVSGTASVKRSLTKATISAPIELATLTAGAFIGITNDGFFARDGRRTATVVALSDMILLQIGLGKFDQFIFSKTHLYPAVHEDAAFIMRMALVRQLKFFHTFTMGDIDWLVAQVDEVNFPANTQVFAAGNESDACYLVKLGEIAVCAKSDSSCEKFIPHAVFGENGILEETLRSATAAAVEDSVLLVLKKAHLSRISAYNPRSLKREAILSSGSPMLRGNISVQKQIPVGGKSFFVITNDDNSEYLRLDEKDWNIYQLIDGKITVREIINKCGSKLNNVGTIAKEVNSLLVALESAGFVSGLKFKKTSRLITFLLWMKTVVYEYISD